MKVSVLVSGLVLISLALTIEGYLKQSGKSLKPLGIATRNISAQLARSIGRVSILKHNEDKNSIDELILKEMMNIQGELIPFDVTFIFRNVSVYHLPDSSFITFGSLSLMRHFYNVTFFYTPSAMRKEYQYFVHCVNSTYEDIAKLRAPSQMEFHYFIVEEKKSIRLLTFIWYTKRTCLEPELIEVNRFSKISMKWKTNEFSVRKFRNLHGCQIKVLNPNMRSRSKNYQIELNKKILQGLRRYFNFKIKFISIRNSTIIDVSLETKALHQLITSFKFHAMTRPYLFEDIRFAVPIGEKFNGYEKLLLPFDLYVWFLIALTFLVAFSTIFVSRFLTSDVRNFIIGQHVNTPTLNVVMVFFGISQIELPGRNFARYLVMTFILYSLIIRTAWQGKNFEFLQKEMRKPEAQSIQEMVEKDYTFHYYDFYNHIRGIMYSKITEIKPLPNYTVLKHPNLKRTGNATDFYHNYPKKLENPFFKGVMLVRPEWLHHYVVSTNGSFLRRIRKDSLFTEYLGWEFTVTTTKQWMYNTLDEVLQKYFSSGIIEFYNSEFKESLKPKRYEHLYQEGPQVLTMEHLEASFVIWMISILATVLVFIGEWIVVLKDYLVSRWIIQAYFERKHFDLLRDLQRKRNLMKVKEQKI